MSRRRNRLRPAARLSAALILLIAPAVHAAGRPADSPVKSIHPLADDIGHVSWVGKRIAFDRLNADKYFEIWSMNDDGTDQKCLTCMMCPLPPGHRGNPDISPDGALIVFQGQSGDRSAGKSIKELASPGSGLNNDLWVMDDKGMRYMPLSHVPPQQGGILHPHFAPDNRSILWSERHRGEDGRSDSWAMRLARFGIDPKAGPRISDLQTFQPGQHRDYYEAEGFSPDGAKIVFSANLSWGQDITGLDIYTLDLQSNEVKNLTSTQREWDEHAHYSPSGKHIVWMSSRGQPPPTGPADLQTDYWIMDADGSNQRRLTFFNDKDSPDYIAGGVTASDFAWSPDGTKLAAVLIPLAKGEKNKVVEIEFKEGQ